MDDISKDVPYDLRQVYAIEILGEHLKDIARARKIDSFSMYYKCLKDVFIVVQHKFKKKEEAKKKYKEKMEAVAKLANKNTEVWLRKSNDQDKYSEIEAALNDVEMYLYDKIEEAKIFGAAKGIPGL